MLNRLCVISLDILNYNFYIESSDKKNGMVLNDFNMEKNNLIMENWYIKLKRHSILTL